MKKLLFAFLGLLGAMNIAAAQTPLTPTQMQAYINQYIFPNNVGAVTPQILNNTLTQMLLTTTYLPNQLGVFGAGLPVISGGAGAPLSVGTKSGSTTLFATALGTLVNGHCVSIDGNGNFVDAGAACTTGGGGGTVSAGAANNLALYVSSGTAVAGLATANNGVLVTSASGVPSISSVLPAFTTLSMATSATTPSTSTTTGAIIDAGGLGVSGNLNIGGLFNLGNSANTTDGTAMQNSWLVSTLSRAGTSTPASANEFGTFFSSNVTATAAAASYEKGTLYARVATADASQYTPTVITRDAVASQFTGDILPGNMLGRAWGTDIIAQVNSGADGLSIGNEVDMENSGTAQTDFGTSTSKYAYIASANAGNNLTGAYVIQSGGSAFQNGIYMQGASIASAGYFFQSDANGGTYWSQTGRIAIGTTPVFPYWLYAKQATGQQAIRLETADTSDLYVNFTHTSSLAWELGLHGTDNSFDVCSGGSGLGSGCAFKLSSAGVPSFPLVSTGTPATYACFDSSKNLISSATAC